MTFAAIIGIITVILSFIVKVVGFPAQISKIKATKSVESLSLTLFGFSFISYIFWTIHGILEHDWVTIVGQGIGIFVCGYIVFQILTLRKK